MRSIVYSVMTGAEFGNVVFRQTIQVTEEVFLVVLVLVILVESMHEVMQWERRVW